MHRLALGLDRLGVEVDADLAGMDHRLRVPFRPADDRVDARHQFLAVEGLGQVVIRAEAEAAHLVLGVVGAGQDQDRRFDPGHAQLPQHLVPGHVGQVEVEQDQVVVVKLRQIDPLLAQIGAVDIEVGMGQHQFDAA